MALSPNSLARRKPGVQIPSPPPHIPAGQSVVSFERAALTARCGRTAAASASPSPAGKALSDHATRPGPPMMTTEGSRRFQPELRAARQAGLEGHCGSGRWSSRSRDTAGRPGRALLAVRLPAALDALHESRAQTQRTRNAGHRHRTPDVHTRTLDTERVDIACADTGRSHGHWTPDTGRTDTTDYADRAPRHGWHPDRHPGSPRPADCPLGRGTVDLWTAPSALGNDDRSARVGYPPARDYLPRYQAPARSLRRPGRASAHCCPQTITGRA
jgi:hypothetical protein